MTLGSMATRGSSTFLGLAIGDWATYLACGVAVLVAVAAWIQAKQATRQNTSGTIGSLLQAMNDIFIANSDLRPFFFETGDTVPPDSTQKAQAIAASVLNTYEVIWSLAPHMKKSTRDAWKSYISGELNERPLLADKFAKQRNDYPNLVDAANAKPDRKRRHLASKALHLGAPPASDHSDAGNISRPSAKASKSA